MALGTSVKAPDFCLKSKTADGLVDVKLSDVLKSGPVVLLFFPAAFTGVCTQEMCDMSGGLGAYKDLQATVFGISCDSAFAQEAWAKANGITVQLLSDYQHKVTEAYDVVLPDLVGLGPASARAAFVIDQQGVIRYSEQTPTPLDVPDFDEILRTVASLKA